MDERDETYPVGRLIAGAFEVLCWLMICLGLWMLVEGVLDIHRSERMIPGLFRSRALVYLLGALPGIGTVMAGLSGILLARIALACFDSAATARNLLAEGCRGPRPADGGGRSEPVVTARRPDRPVASLNPTRD